MGAGQGMDSTYHFSGSLNNDSWTFEYPRSLYEKCYSFRFIIPTHTDTIEHAISFKQIINKDTVSAPQYLFDNVDSVTINAGKKIKTNTFPGKKLVLNDVYFLNNMTDKEYLSSVELAANRGFITDILDPNYNKVINQFAKTVQKYPDSHTLINFLFRLKQQYHTRDDVEKIYNNFSDRQKQSYFGKGIEMFLSDTVKTVLYFKNILLPAWDTEISEPIIKDFSKVNLVIFSASWCAPCIAEIPHLKKIAKELNGKINMVYVSVDEIATVNAWKKLMIDNKIPWRSVLAAKNLNEIKKQFTNEGIPAVYMVHPDSTYEKIEVRYDGDLKKLYQFVDNYKITEGKMQSPK